MSPMERPLIAVVTDSAASLPADVVKQLGIEVVPLYLSIDGESLRDTDVSDFYRRLPAAGEVSTASPAPGDFLSAFARTGAAEVVCVTVASSVSGVHGSARIAAETAEARVEVVDSGAASMAEGFVAMEAARAARTGVSMDEVVRRARDIASRVSLLAAIETFEYLRRSGRVGRLVSYAGTMLDIKPVFRLSRGEISAVARPRTRRRAIERIAVEAERAIGGAPAHIAAVHTGAEEEARELLATVSERVDVVEKLVAGFTPAMGAHTGPGVVGLAFFAE